MKSKIFSTRIVLVGVSALALVGLGIVVTGGVFCQKAQAVTCNHQNTQTEVLYQEELAPNYFPYSPSALESATQNGRTVLYFWAPWCASCSSLDLELQEEKTSIPNGITLLRVNYDQETELKKTYQVTMQHTFVQIDQSGETIAKWVGGDIVDFSRYIK